MFGQPNQWQNVCVCRPLNKLESTNSAKEWFQRPHKYLIKIFFTDFVSDQVRLTDVTDLFSNFSWCFLWFFFSSDIFSGQVVMSGTKPKLRTQVPILHQIIIMKIRILFEIRKHNFGQDLIRIKPVQLWKGTNWVVVPPF